jgi:hypothetical protein
LLGSILEGNIEPFIKKVKEYHKKKSFRSFREYNENSFQTTVELLLPAKCWSSEMRIIVQHVKPNVHKYGFIDIFICDNNFGSAVLELKLFNLVGLFSGSKGKVMKNPDYNSLVEFDNILKSESEDELLNRNYYFWSKDETKYKLTKVRKVINDGMHQINNYIGVVGKGKSSNKNVGICDEKIGVEEGIGLLGGYLIASFGTQRLLVKSIGFKRINYNFYIKFR